MTEPETNPTMDAIMALCAVFASQPDEDEKAWEFFTSELAGCIADDMFLTGLKLCHDTGHELVNSELLRKMFCGCLEDGYEGKVKAIEVSDFMVFAARHAIDCMMAQYVQDGFVQFALTEEGELFYRYIGASKATS